MIVYMTKMATKPTYGLNPSLDPEGQILWALQY